jgi:hypothetical protein
VDELLTPCFLHASTTFCMPTDLRRGAVEDRHVDEPPIESTNALTNGSAALAAWG